MLARARNAARLVERSAIGEQAYAVRLLKAREVSKLDALFASSLHLPCERLLQTATVRWSTAFSQSLHQPYARPGSTLCHQKTARDYYLHPPFDIRACGIIPSPGLAAMEPKESLANTRASPRPI